jgi:uncharacterized membrane protein YedE/YeeE
LEEISPRILTALAGFAIGLVFGAVVQRTNFCAMGAVSDVVILRDWRRLRAWLLAIAVAILGAQGLAAAGVVDLRDSIYLDSRLTWAAAILGGLMFGIGMVLAGGCGSRNLVRFGAGDLRAFVVVLVLGIGATMTLHGLTALPRVWLNDATAIDLSARGFETQALPSLLEAGLGGGAEIWQTATGAILALALLLFCLASPAFRRAGQHVLSGLILGLLVTAGWWATAVLGADDFEPAPLASLTFVAPVGDSLLYLMTFTGSEVDFGIAAVGGAVLGAFATAKATGVFRLQTFGDRGDFLRNLMGAFLMGVGGVTALGCTIGQGITGLSTLALGSFLAFGSIVLGGVLGVHILARLPE